jgi:putative phosphoesterase
MRLGVLADIHANLPALEAALALLRREGVDRYLCLGDLVGYGPHPNECVAAVAELGTVCVAGNHDLIALDRLPDDQCIPLARNSLRWTREHLNDASRRYLAALPLRATAGEVVLAHGSLDNPREYVRTPTQAQAQLAQLAAEYPGSSLLLLGHTHRRWAYGEQRGEESGDRVSLGARALLNPGSVGQSREWRAAGRCLLLDLERREARFFTFAYDTARCRRDLLAAGLPPRSCHLAPSLAGLCRRGLRRLLTPRSPEPMPSQRPKRSGAL